MTRSAISLHTVDHGKFLFYRLQAGKFNVKMNKLETL